MLPEKLLQFRPLDLLRVDLFAVAGLAGLAAQVGYSYDKGPNTAAVPAGNLPFLKCSACSISQLVTATQQC